MNPINAIQKLVELGVKQSVLEQYLGLRAGKISEIIAGKTSLKSKDYEKVVAGIIAFKKEIEKIEIDEELPTDNYSIYVHIFPNDKRYYGISQYPEGRWGKQGEGYRNQKRMWAAIEEFGWGNIKHEIIMTNLTRQSALMIEEALINQYKTNVPACGYNEYT